MESRRFDDFARSLVAPRSRRGLLGGLSAMVLAGRTASAQVTCPEGQTRNAKGKCSCPAGTDACPNGCFDRKRDASNCGGCGVTCPSGAVCRKGSCVCPSGTESCLGDCLTTADFQTDPFNCGGCGNTCDVFGAGEGCVNGSCCTPDCTGKLCGEPDGCGGTCSAGCATCQACNGSTCVNVTGPQCGDDGATTRCCNGQCGACLQNSFVCQVGSGRCDNDCSLCCSGNYLRDPNQSFLFCA